MTTYQILQFAAHHWILASLFLLIAIFILILEIRARSGHTNNPTPQEAIRLINHEQAVVVDIRPNNLFKEGHIVNALNLSDALIDKQIGQLKKYKDRPLIIVCNVGQQAIKYREQLKKHQLENVYVIHGGMNAWRRANLPITKK